MRMLAVLIVMMAPLAACGGDDDSSCDPDAGGAAVSVPADLPDIVCESVDDATDSLEDAGYTLRVTRLDGEDLAATADFVENRVNVAVETQDDVEIVVEILALG